LNPRPTDRKPKCLTVAPPRHRDITARNWEHWKNSALVLGLRSRSSWDRRCEVFWPTYADQAAWTFDSQRVHSPSNLRSQMTALAGCRNPCCMGSVCRSL